MKKRFAVVVDADGFVHVDGVKVARRVERNGEVCLRFVDKCRRRTSDRGSKEVEIPAADFDKAILDGPAPESTFHID